MSNIFETYYNRAASICARQEKCRSDIKKKLIEWGVESAFRDKILDSLEREGFINEERFACFYVRDKFKFNRWGENKIRFNLRNREVSDSVIDVAFSKADIERDDYIKALESLLTFKSKKLTFSDAYKKKAALIRFAYSRGYSYDDILMVIERLKLLD
ncbi:regulatory protein RecX [Marinilabiliaceae bacterium ANBcel2]|nr:regulatory protein RecX [Marinilabiliaceae bacterium ANBcel2]